MGLIEADETTLETARRLCAERGITVSELIRDGVYLLQRDAEKPSDVIAP